MRVFVESYFIESYVIESYFIESYFIESYFTYFLGLQGRGTLHRGNRAARTCAGSRGNVRVLRLLQLGCFPVFETAIRQVPSNNDRYLWRASQARVTKQTKSTRHLWGRALDVTVASTCNALALRSACAFAGWVSKLLMNESCAPCSASVPPPQSPAGRSLSHSVP